MYEKLLFEKNHKPDFENILRLLINSLYLEQKQCSFCHAKPPSGANYCHKCGNRFQRVVTPRIESEVHVVQVARCPDCKCKNDSTATKCKNCGVNFRSTSDLELFSFLK